MHSKRIRNKCFNFVFLILTSLIKIFIWLWPYDKLSTETVKLTTKLKKVFQMNFKLPRAVQLKLQVTAVPLGPGNETIDLFFIIIFFYFFFQVFFFNNIYLVTTLLLTILTFT